MYSLLPGLVASIYLGFGVVILAIHGFNRIGVSFILLCGTSAFWQGTWAIMFQMHDPIIIGWLVRLGYFAIAFLPTTLYHFLVELSGAQEERRHVLLSYCVAGALGLSALHGTLFVRGYYEYFFGPYPKVGILHVAHLLQTAMVVNWALYITYRQQRTASITERTQLRICMGAVFIYFLAAIDYLSNYGVEIYPPGFIFIGISLGIFTVAMVRFKLFDQTTLDAFTTISNVSHELRGPVNAARLLVETAASDAPFPEHHRTQFIALMNHMGELVDDLLLLDPKRASNRLTAKIEVFDLAEGIRTSALLVPQGSAELIFHVSACDGIFVKGDKTALRRILSNLISNAYKYTPVGTITVEAEVEQYLHKEAVRCTVTVTDTGFGVSPTLKDSIFEPFVTDSDQPGKSGVGLGLPIAQQLAHKLGGSLRLVWSRVNEGSCFEFNVLFSVAEPPKLDITLPATFADSQLPPEPYRYAVIAEDEPTTAMAVRLILEQLGFVVTQVSNWTALGDVLNDLNRPIDVALIDHQLPDGSGLQMINFCKKNGLRKKTRFVLVTGHIRDDILHTAEEVCDAVILKPTTPEHIRAALAGISGLQMTPANEPLLVDEKPIRVLANSGATQTDLNRIYQMFCTSVDEAIDEIEANINLSEERIGVLGHRTISACSTIGAIGLAKQISILAECYDDANRRAQLLRVRQAYNSSKQIIETILPKASIANEQRQ